MDPVWLNMTGEERNWIKLMNHHDEFVWKVRHGKLVPVYIIHEMAMSIDKDGVPFLDVTIRMALEDNDGVLMDFRTGERFMQKPIGMTMDGNELPGEPLLWSMLERDPTKKFLKSHATPGKILVVPLGPWDSVRQEIVSLKRINDDLSVSSPRPPSVQRTCPWCKGEGCERCHQRGILEFWGTE
jgi:hypothetical protein